MMDVGADKVAEPLRRPDSGRSMEGIRKSGSHAAVQVVHCPVRRVHDPREQAASLALKPPKPSYHASSNRHMFRAVFPEM
jgi:hypothetical protein